MAFKPKPRTLAGKPKPEPFSRTPNVAFCPTCKVKRMVGGGMCLTCGGKV